MIYQIVHLECKQQLMRRYLGKRIGIGVLFLGFCVRVRVRVLVFLFAGLFAGFVYFVCEVCDWGAIGVCDWGERWGRCEVEVKVEEV